MIPSPEPVVLGHCTAGAPWDQCPGCHHQEHVLAYLLDLAERWQNDDPDNPWEGRMFALEILRLVHRKGTP